MVPSPSERAACAAPLPTSRGLSSTSTVTAGVSLPAEILERIFQFTTRGEQVVTVSRINWEWRRWSASRAHLLRCARSKRVYYRYTYKAAHDSSIPLWAVQEAWPQLHEDHHYQLAERSALHGAADALAWILDNSPSQRLVQRKYFSFCSEAAAAGHLNVLQVLHARGYDIELNSIEAAARGGHLAILQWRACDNRKWDEHCVDVAGKGAVQSGGYAILRWLSAQGFTLGTSACTAAATHGCLEMLQWLHAKGYPWNTDAPAGAAFGGHLEVLQWLHAHGCPWDEETCTAAAEGGHLHLLKWLHAHDCPWDTQTSTQAADLDDGGAMLEWLYDNCCPIYGEGIAELHPELRDWLEERDLIYPVYDRSDSAEFVESDASF